MADYYCNIFPDTKIISENPIVVMLSMAGQNMMLLNGGNQFKPNPSISFMGIFDNDDEVKTRWHKLIDGGQALMELGAYPWSSQYGWLNDKYGVSWQLYKGETGGAKEKYVPTLMFNNANNGKAKEAVNFYTQTFANSSIQGIMEYSGKEGEQQGNVQHAQFDIDGFTLMCMDSSAPHQFNFNEGISLVVNCKNQQEIDTYWHTLTSNGGAESQCGWLKDKYGVSWQIIPENIMQLIRPKKAMEAMLQMKKLDIAILEQAGKE